jgi:hypothetical protein
LAEHGSNKTVGSGIRRLYFEKTLSEAGLDNPSDTCSAQFLTVRDRATPGERISAIDCATAYLTRSTAHRASRTQKIRDLG